MEPDEARLLLALIALNAGAAPYSRRLTWTGLEGATGYRIQKLMEGGLVESGGSHDTVYLTKLGADFEPLARDDAQ